MNADTIKREAAIVDNLWVESEGSSSTVPTLTARIGSIAGSYGRLKCKEAADAMKKELVKNKEYGAIIRLYFPNAHYGFVGSNKTGGSIVISENDTHYGVFYNGNVYCNIYPEGLPEQQ